jgi:hypothetical protein
MLIAGDDPIIDEQIGCIDLTFRSFGGINFGEEGFTIRLAPALARDFDEAAARDLATLRAARGRFGPITAAEQHDLDITHAAHATLDCVPSSSTADHSCFHLTMR